MTVKTGFTETVDMSIYIYSDPTRTAYPCTLALTTSIGCLFQIVFSSQ
jgi:hypothetical protein